MRLLADEDIDNRIIRGLRRDNPDVDVVRVQDTEVFRAKDPAVLEWAAKEGRILFTHDVNTMTKHAYDRIAAGLPMPGVLHIPQRMPLGQVIDEMLLIVGASDPQEYDYKVIHLPMT